MFSKLSKTISALSTFTIFSIYYLLLAFPAYAVPPPPPGVNPFGPLALPPGVDKYGSLTSGGLVNFITAVLRTMILLGALFSLVNFILAGYQYLSAAGDPKALQGAWGKIWQSLLGLTICFGSFILAAIFGYIFTKDATFILQPKLYGP